MDFVGWIDFEKEKPKSAGYYLCKTWGFSENQYGNFTDLNVLYWNKDKFGGYPKMYHDSLGEICSFEKVIWWSIIPETPINKDHLNFP
jgi:hypothetical protein